MTTKSRFTKRLLSVLTAGIALLAFSERASAQELYLTGPLAGATGVRKLRLYRQNRFEIAPTVSFTLLDQYQRTILLGGRITYNFTDWLGVGGWGAVGSVVRLQTALTDHIQDVNADRKAANRACEADPAGAGCGEATLANRLTRVNLGNEFKKQLGGIDWVAAPQLTVIPFRGKLALFQSIYVDTDLFVSAGPAFIGVKERKNCTNCAGVFQTSTRTAIAPTVALGLSFYPNKWSSFSFDGRIMPFSWNRSGFDIAGGGKDNEFPDNKITSADRSFAWNPMMSVSFSIYLPTQYKVSE